MSNLQTRNFYEILNCSPNASIEELKTNYKQLILQCHPDKLQQQQQQQDNNPQLEQLLENLEIKNATNNKDFMAITEAWNCLKDPQKRKQYDAELLVNKFHTHNNIYAHITLKEMKKQPYEDDETEVGDGEEQKRTLNYIYTYDCRCGGQYIVDESAKQYFCTNNQHSHTHDDIQQQQQKLDKDNNGDAELNTQNNKNRNNTNKNENNDGGGNGDGGASSEGVVFLQQDPKETPPKPTPAAARTAPVQDFKYDNDYNNDDENNDDDDGDLIVECSECSLVIILNG